MTFTADVIFDYRNSAWNFQPLQQLTAGDANGVLPATFTGQRPAAPEPVGGDVKLGTFNVLNYFTTTGAAYEAATGTDCTSFDDRAGNPIGVNTCTGDAGPRGAWDDANLARQQIKIVKAINALGADVVSLEEIENSAKFGIDRDTALAALVAALNAAAGAGDLAVRAVAGCGRPAAAGRAGRDPDRVHLQAGGGDTGRRVHRPGRQRGVRRRARTAGAGVRAR